MWAYALIATGLINWDYQRAKPNIAVHSLAIIIPGLLLLIATFLKSTKSLLEKKVVRFAWLLVGVIALAYAFLN
jgi:uncharacterized membrane protein